MYSLYRWLGAILAWVGAIGFGGAIVTSNPFLGLTAGLGCLFGIYMVSESRAIEGEEKAKERLRMMAEERRIPTPEELEHSHDHIRARRNPAQLTWHLIKLHNATVGPDADWPGLKRAHQELHDLQVKQ